jgi:hypothetical protein
MLEITKKIVSLEPQEVMELERIMIDEDQSGAYVFLKKIIYHQLAASQEGHLKSHLDWCNDPASSFAVKNK